MAAMLARQQLDDERTLAVAPRGQHDAVIAPLHFLLANGVRRSAHKRL
jgi:hypothetical protein